MRISLVLFQILQEDMISIKMLNSEELQDIDIMVFQWMMVVDISI